MKKVRTAPKSDLIFTVGEECQLHQFLAEKFDGKSRSALKSLLAHRRVSVNGTVTTAYDSVLRKGDKVSINRGRAAAELHHPMLRIVFEDKHIIVVDKRNGLLSMGTDKQRDKTAYSILSHHVKLEDPANRIFIVHRLDRETSGLMIFAKSEEIKHRLQADWHRIVIDRKYIAVADGVMPATEGTIDAPLAENRNRKMFVSRTPEEDNAVDAVTHYRVLRSRGGRSLVELSLETGRKNQIRAHLEHVGCPVAGDKKYSSRSTDAGRVCLHAYKLALYHPVTGEELFFSTSIPKLFDNLI